MSVSTTDNKKTFNGSGTTGPFTFDFRFFYNSEIHVVKTSSSGVDTELTENVQYTLSGSGSYSGGSVTLSSALASGEKLTIYRKVDLVQPVDLRNQGAFFAEIHEDVFDRMTMVGQQLQEQIDRCAKLPITNVTDAENLVQDIILLADNIDNLNTIVDNTEPINTVADHVTNVNTVSGHISNVDMVAGHISNVDTAASHMSAIDTVASDLNEPVSEIETVSGSITNVNTVAGISGNVTTVAGISANVTSVAGNATNINAVAGNATNINAVNANKANIDAVAGNATNINAVNSNKANIDTVAGKASDITTVAGISAAVSTVAGNTTNINTVATNNSNVTATGSNISNVNTVAGQITPTNNVATVAGKATEITTVAGISGNVTTVAGISGNVTTVAGISANVTTVAGKATEVTTVAGISSAVSTVAGISSAVSNVSAIDDEVAAVAGNATNINAVNANATNINTVASINSDVTAVAAVDEEVQTVADNLTNINSFFKVYLGAKSSDPATRNDGTALVDGDMYSNTSTTTMRFYASGAWHDTGITFNPSVQRFSGTGSQTAFTMSSSPGTVYALIVNISGVVQTPGVDFTFAGTTLTFTTAPPSGTNNITVQNFGSAGVINVPATGSVTTASLAEGFVAPEATNASNVHWSGVSSKPTTLSGYGITDAAPSSHVGATGAAHGAATTGAAGFMSTTDKSKLDGIASGANNYTLPAATSSTLGGVKVSLSGTTLTISTT